MKIGIIGHGVVGSALDRVLRERHYTPDRVLRERHYILVHDPQQGHDDEAAFKANVVMVAIPSAACDGREIDSLMARFAPGVCVAIRTIVMPGTTRRLDADVAEVAKLMSNSFYALKVAFCNQLYDACREADIDYSEVRRCAEADPWIGGHHLNVWHKGARGFGGKCLPKDTRALAAFCRVMGQDPTILEAALRYNDVLCPPGTK